MPKPTPLEIAHALRSTAEWVAKPTTPQCSGKQARDARGQGVPANSPEAVEWCALGHIAKQLDLESIFDIGWEHIGRRPGDVYGNFDHSRHYQERIGLRRKLVPNRLSQQLCIRALSDWAQQIEDNLPVAERMELIREREYADSR